MLASGSATPVWRIGWAALLLTVTARILLGNFVVNDWEGWSTFIGNAIGALIEGLLLFAIVLALVVRLTVERVPGTAGVVMGVVALATLAVPYSAPQAILGAGATALGLAGQSRWAVGMGTVTVLTWIALMAYAVATGDWPIG